MKTPEDEAWEEMERKQGGGFQAKRAMAADKLKEPYCYVDPVHLAALNTHQSALVTLHKNPSGYASRGLYTTPPAQEPATGREAFKRYIEDCDKNAIVPDVAGAFHAAWQAQAAQEPVAWITPDGEGFRIRFSTPTNDVPLGWDALYTTPPKRERVLFPTMLRKMWSGSEVQAWLDENVNKEQNNG